VRRKATGRDAELKARMAVVLGLLVTTAAAAAYGLASLFFFWPGWWPLWALIAVLLVVGLGTQYGAGQGALLKAADARLVRPTDEPNLTPVIERVAAVADLPPPQFAISSSAVPNAFAFGWASHRSVVVLSRGLCDALTSAELEAVVAHEISHIANRDTLVMTAVTMPRALGAQLFTTEGWGIYFWFFLWPLGFVLWAWSTVLTLALSRYRELAADRGSALLTGAPEQLMSALQKLADGISRIPQGDLRATAGLEALFIVPTRARRFDFLADHPPLEKRLSALAQLAREMGRPAH
jgi:heat shock protein HtpX